MMAMGCDQLSAHLFVFYFAILAGVTPPVCIPAYCAASIAASRPLQTGFEAFKLALVGFLIPYVFIYNQALLMRGTALEIMTIVAVLLIAIILLAGAMSGYLIKILSFPLRVLCLGAALGVAFLGTRAELLQMPVVQGTIFVLLLLILSRWLSIRRRNSREKE